MKKRTYRYHFLNVVHIKIHDIAPLRPNLAVPVDFDDSSAQLLERVVGVAEHSQVIF